MSVYDLVIVGAGPAGLAASIAAKGHGLRHVVLEKGAIVNTILHFPLQMVFFTTPELLEIGNLPFVTPYEKPTRAEALRYYRRVVDTFELPIEMGQTVSSVTREGEHLVVATTTAAGAQRWTARAVVIATGAYDLPNRMEIPGEDLPHVSHYYTEAHAYFRKNVVVVGGANSTADAALEMYRAGVKVTIVHRGEDWHKGLKYWVRPDLENRIKEGAIAARMRARVTRITHTDGRDPARRRHGGIAAGRGRVPADRLSLRHDAARARRRERSIPWSWRRRSIRRRSRPTCPAST